MDHFLYRNGILHVEDVAIAAIAAEVGTPFYVYSAATLSRHFQLFREALDGMDHLICFAVKSNSNLAVLKLLGDLGAGMDVVSIGEYLRARAAGVPGERIVFSGVGKTRAEMRTALEGGLIRLLLDRLTGGRLQRLLQLGCGCHLVDLHADQRQPHLCDSRVPAQRLR